MDAAGGGIAGVGKVLGEGVTEGWTLVFPLKVA